MAPFGGDKSAALCAFTHPYAAPYRWLRPLTTSHSPHAHATPNLFPRALQHQCNYDWQADAQKLLALQNPKVQAAKLERM